MLPLFFYFLSSRYLIHYLMRAFKLDSFTGLVCRNYRCFDLQLSSSRSMSLSCTLPAPFGFLFSNLLFDIATNLRLPIEEEISFFLKPSRFLTVIQRFMMVVGFGTKYQFRLFMNTSTNNRNNLSSSERECWCFFSILFFNTPLLIAINIKHSPL